ncbi:hypothetical protein SELMODRAFT_424600 [Selaginella moellendorffii]|uniref:Cyanovirin-N domain-containing protein n=1 Tax=Selaginella moellendorffii TaxID=88036 RepID=D8SQF6_SELML|nr:hypothetical protein SELMODRAFT_424600 [Selaginella moellendorffii]
MISFSVISSIVAAVALLLAMQIKACGDFSKVCTDIQLTEDKTFITAICPPRTRTAYLPIYRFVGNTNGKLCYPGSDFLLTCDEVSVERMDDGDYYLLAMCRTNDPHLSIGTEINLDKFVFNKGGYLRLCHRKDELLR